MIYSTITKCFPLQFSSSSIFSFNQIVDCYWTWPERVLKTEFLSLIRWTNDLISIDRKLFFNPNPMRISIAFTQSPLTPGISNYIDNISYLSFCCCEKWFCFWIIFRSGNWKQISTACFTMFNSVEIQIKLMQNKIYIQMCFKISKKNV